MNAPPPFSNHLEVLREDVLNHLAALLENQTRSQFFASSLSELILTVHREIAEELQASAGSEDVATSAQAVQRMAATCARLDDSLELLFGERGRQWHLSGQHLQALMREFNATLGELSSTLIEKDLLERQSRVLERIILSHERVTQWKEFVQEILGDFHAIFPFNFFFIAFTEEHGLSLYLYFLGSYSDEIHEQVRNLLTRRMLEGLKLPSSAPLDIEEFAMPNGGSIKSIDDVRMVTVAVPEHAPKLAGLLGVAYASENNLSPQEESVIRSILAVMVMVVGSSKVLSRTLAELEYYSLHDPLTGLCNRRYFNDILEYEIARSERHHHEFALLMLDIDNFKDVNDSYGHPAGDKALTEVANVLSLHTRKGDWPTRLGGDEFAMLLVETGRTGALILADAVGQALREMRFDTDDGKYFHLTVSIGVVIYPNDAQAIGDLLSNVDIAMYQAKEQGKDTVCTMDAVGNRLQLTRTTREYAESLRAALNEHRIVPYFQPIVDCRSGKVFAYETVARLKELNGDTVSANMFIKTIEKYGLSREMDRVIVEKSLAAKRTAGMGLNDPAAPIKIFINLSPQEIQNRGILGYTEELCNRMGVPPTCIVFEILERDAIGDMTNMRKFLSNLRSKGFAFALDDFGSGYNSFHYLRELHFEYVKIDGAFVRNILNSKIDYALVRNLSNLCQDIGTQTIAEFVESQEICNALRIMDIDYAQGYYLGMPLPEMRFFPPACFIERQK
jgi:diguanylate cyclase (GGDEF)-like protein